MDHVILCLNSKNLFDMNLKPNLQPKRKFFDQNFKFSLIQTQNENKINHIILMQLRENSSKSYL